MGGSPKRQTLTFGGQDDDDDGPQPEPGSEADSDSDDQYARDEYERRRRRKQSTAAKQHSKTSAKDGKSSRAGKSRRAHKKVAFQQQAAAPQDVDSKLSKKIQSQLRGSGNGTALLDPLVLSPSGIRDFGCPFRNPSRTTVPCSVLCYYAR